MDARERRYKMRIKDTLSRRPHCELIERTVHRIVERLRQIDRGYFVVFNKRRGVYEVHNTANFGNTYCFTVPYSSLDARTIEYCRETSTANNIATAIEKHNERLERSNDRARKNLNKDMASELADRIAYTL